MSLDYTIRESSKAKHISLKMSIKGDLEVIVPKGFDRKRIPEILQRKQHWIERVSRRMATQQALVGTDVSDDRPQQIALQAIAENWQVEYGSTRRADIQLVEQPNFALMLRGDITDSDTCKAMLQEWVAHKARTHLPSWLRMVSQEIKLPFKKASIRQQKTIWGSCSVRKTISLNCKLLFLPTPLVRYVFIHELCHTVHLNHSKDFWALVSRHEPDYQSLDASLRDARYLVPWWME
ncbi:MAG: M48 family metallopeptidase [Leptolyngbyaceae cyanobacterium RU_5_1]|nr:M48 family metallopeptidase [Leptolyngbyaceae cyanobacterium RU_5_1]